MKIARHVFACFMFISFNNILLSSLSVSFLQHSSSSNLMVAISFVRHADLMMNSAIKRFWNSVATLPLSLGAYRRFAVLIKSCGSIPLQSASSSTIPNQTLTYLLSLNASKSSLVMSLCFLVLWFYLNISLFTVSSLIVLMTCLYFSPKCVKVA